ncbi:hypothetical protein [Pseudomonas syringae]|uniref:hypothetical protein n=1 Tax=Pseudomonas syringae TaxID=317 RepID=UPI00051618EB|nr:hypothetical protein [Pseudomonas syringae]POP71960.1 hypothetical protein CXB37_27045 [Pseudomonas syringae pv. syringae]
MTVKFIEKITQDAFGLWISALFSSISSWNPDLSFTQQKDAFFTIVEHLLNHGKIKFIAPDADCYVSPDNPHPKLTINDSEAHWNLEAEQIIDYLKSKWPDEVTSANDEELTYYFYEIPGVIWVDNDGKFIAS